MLGTKLGNCDGWSLGTALGEVEGNVLGEKLGRVDGDVDRLLVISETKAVASHHYF